jgi:hypothetical protein
MRYPIAIIAVLFLAWSPSAASAGGWKAGAAKVIITPDHLMWMSGYGARNKPAEGKLTELYAKGLAIEDAGGHRSLLITMDLVGIDRELSLRVRKRLEEKHKLARSGIALCCSHTHSGPVVGDNLKGMLPLDDEQRKLARDYAITLENKLVDAGDEAMAHLAPATVEWGVGEAAFAKNRRTNVEAKVPELMLAGTLRGPFDHDLPVLAIRSKGGDVQAIVFGYACHATVLSGYDWCADWPGYAQSEIEATHPGAVALFVAGCGGDQNPLPRRKVELAQKYGREAAAGVEAVLKSGAMKKIDGALSAAYSEIDVPFSPIPTREQFTALLKSKNKYEARLAEVMLAQLDHGEPIPTTYPYPVEVWKLGPDLTWVILGGEVVVDYSLRLKKELGAKTWVSSYSNDVMAYIPSARVLKEGGYEGATSMIYYGHPSPWAPGIEEMIVKEVHRLNDTLGR